MNVARLPRPTGLTLSGAVGRFLDRPVYEGGTVDTYRDALGRLVDDVGDIPVADVDEDAIERHLTGRYGDASAAYFNRNRAAISSLFAWAVKKRWVTHNPVATVDRAKERATDADVNRVIAFRELEKAWNAPDVPLRERTLWVMLYETAARSQEILGLNVEDLDLAERTGVVTGKGGDRQQVFWATTTARLLGRYLDGRETGPVFLTDRRPTRPMPARDTSPDGYARLSYRRAAEQFTGHTGWTLHQLRHSALTHLAEDGVDVTLLKAKSRHASLRSLEGYVRPSAATVKQLTDDHDRARRR